MSEHMENRQDSAAPYLFLLTTMALFGSAFASSKVLVGEMPHQVAAALRFGGGAVILLLLLLFMRDRGASFSRRDAIRAGLVGLLGVFAYNFLFFWGISLAPSLDGSIIVPVMVPVLTTAYLLLTGREAIGFLRIVGLMLGVAGAVVFFFGVGAGTEFSGSQLAGDFVFLLGASCWAAYSIASKKVLVGIDPLRATTYATVVGALALMVVAAPSLTEVEWTAVSATAWANVIYLAIGPTAVAYLFYYRGLRMVSPSTATIMMFTAPVFGVVCSVFFLGESFTLTQLGGAIIMITGAMLAVMQRPKGINRRENEQTAVTTSS